MPTVQQPLMLEDWELPLRLKILTYADFRRPGNRDAELARLLGQMEEAPETPPVHLISQPAPRVSLAKFPSTDPFLFGREEQLALLDRA